METLVQLRLRQMEMLGPASAILVRSDSVLVLRLGPMHLVEAAAQRWTVDEVRVSGIARFPAERTDLDDIRGYQYLGAAVY